MVKPRAVETPNGPCADENDTDGPRMPMDDSQYLIPEDRPEKLRQTGSSRPLEGPMKP